MWVVCFFLLVNINLIIHLRFIGISKIFSKATPFSLRKSKEKKLKSCFLKLISSYKKKTNNKKGFCNIFMSPLQIMIINEMVKKCILIQIVKEQI